MLFRSFLDPLADKLLMTSGYIVMATMFWPEPRIPKWVVVIVISRDVLMVVFYGAFVAMGTGFRQLAPSFLGKLCTTFQMTTLVTVLSAPGIAPFVGERAMHDALTGLFFATAFLTLVTGFDYLYGARAEISAPEHVALVESDDPTERV